MLSVTASARPKRPVKGRASKLPIIEHKPRTSTGPDIKAPLKPEPLFPPGDELLCLRQVEFYFSDCNLQFDEFLWTLHSKPGADRWVPLSVVARFTRVRAFFDEHGKEWVVAVLRKSARILEVDAAGERVRRKPPVVRQTVSGWCRTVYVKGFERAGDFKCTARDLENWFTQFAYVAAVNMRFETKGPRVFKGSVYVEFADILEAEAFVALQPPPSWNGTELLTMTKQQYCEMKCKEKGLPEGSIAIPRTTEVDRFVRSEHFNAFRRRRAPAVPRGTFDNDEAYTLYMGTVVRVWRPQEGLRAGKKFTDELSRWWYVKKVPHVPGATLELVCATDFGTYIKKLKSAIDGIAGEPVYIVYKDHTTKHRAKFANIFFRKPVSDDVLRRIQSEIPRVGGSSCRIWRVDAGKEHGLQLRNANRMARRALEAVKTPEPVLDYWPSRAEMVHGKVFVVTKDAARNKTPRGAEDTSLATDAAPPAAELVELVSQVDPVPLSAPGTTRKRMRDAGPATTPNKKPKIEPPSTLKHGLGENDGDASHDASRSVRKPFLEATNRTIETPPGVPKRERTDDETLAADRPAKKKVKA
ncbi:hypothetical protein AURDEDRAFT_188358 [Auricularia subglabra TFB-10046 SS5]|nr:hypothetical protein AURDEDRAFT_188358 [Auricularia subglabra TFB-10046 SS5]